MRRAEKLWRMSKALQDQETYKRLKLIHKKMIKAALRKFYQSEFNTCDGNSRKLWRVLNDVTGRFTVPILPTQRNGENIACKFNSFFIEKTDKIREGLDINSCNLQIHSSVSDCNPEQENEDLFSSFDPASHQEVLYTIKKSPATTCSLDPIPTWLLKRCVSSLIPAITAILNRILECGMPMCLKQSIIRPLLKKRDLDSEDFNSYRPVANLPFLSKLVERVVARRLIDYLESRNKLSPFQHAYRSSHSCETALLCMLNDAFEAIDQGQVLLLVLLDLSSAFDVVDHSLLLSRLHNIGVVDNALQWFATYLKGRCQSVMCGKMESQASRLESGVPQGSVLGPLLFSLFINRIGPFIESLGAHCVNYADDIQLFVKSPVADLDQNIKKLEDCIQRIIDWLVVSKLLLNPSKCEFIILSSKKKSHDLVSVPLRIGSVGLSSKSHVRDLGVILDSTLTMEKHVLKVCKSAFFYLRHISRVRNYISEYHTRLLVNALVFSRIEFCVSLLFGTSKTVILKLQKVIRYAIRLIKKCSSSSLVDDTMFLSIQQRSTLRLINITITALSKHVPQFLAKSLTVVQNQSSQILRSQSQGKLTVPRVKTKTGERAFSYAAPRLYNSMPVELQEKSSRMKIIQWILQQ
jgi:hypothetical protein